MENRAAIVTVTSRKGGVGKTASSSLLARYFTEVEGKRVLVVDLDARGGITSLLHDKPISSTDMSVAELLRAAHNQHDVRDIFTSALIETKFANSKHWQDNGGGLYLLPSKPALDKVLPGKPTSLLRTTLHHLKLPEKDVILVDTGSDSNSVRMGVGAALLNHLLQAVTSWGNLRITLNTQKTNAQSIRLYKKFGFTLTKKNYPIFQYSFS